VGSCKMSNPDGRYADAVYFFIAVVIGIAVGVVGGYFHQLIDWLSQWPQWLGGQLQGAVRIAVGALVTMSVAVFCVFIVKRFAPEAGGSGVQEIEGAMEGKRVVRWQRVLPIKFFCGVLSISSGLVLGREGPTIHIGAAIAAGLSEKLRVLVQERKGLLAAGAGAGLACAFNAPVASMVFVAEEMRRQFPFSFRNYVAVGLACVVATVMTEWVGGVAPDLSMTLHGEGVSLPLLLAFVPLGILLGALGVLLNRGLLGAAQIATLCHARVPYAFPAVVGLIVGALLMVFPMAVTGGEHMIQRFNFDSPGLWMLLLLVVVRFFTSTASYASGVPGGIFAPILALAMCVGLACGTMVEILFPHAGVDPVAFGIAAMGGLFTASVHAPTVGIILVAELTGTYQLLLPLAITCLCAHICAKWLGGRPIYEALLERTLEQERLKVAGAQAGQ
jgi:CIC family chloride channel protein